MITAKDTNTVYLSELLFSDERFAKTSQILTNLFDKHAIAYKFIKGTKDIWCRDYMPVQVKKEEFIQFRYEPSYLKYHPELQSCPKEISKLNNIFPQLSNINLDGGNIVNWSDRAIITDRVFDENPAYTNKTKLITEIENLLSAEVIVIPQIKSDMTGHSDGLVRFINRSTILGTDRNSEYKYWSSKINNILKDNGIDYIDIPFYDCQIKNFPEHAIGCYVNFLEVKNLIIIPIFETAGNKDDEVINLFKQIYLDRKIETINYNAVGLHGGLLNCTTWTIQESKT